MLIIGIFKFKFQTYRALWLKAKSSKIHFPLLWHVKPNFSIIIIYQITIFYYCFMNKTLIWWLLRPVSSKLAESNFRVKDPMFSFSEIKLRSSCFITHMGRKEYLLSQYFTLESGKIPFRLVITALIMMLSRFEEYEFNKRESSFIVVTFSTKTS